VFVSYIGLFSYYNFDNWTYQPSFVSSNTPWFFNGLRIQYWPTQDLKIEPWLINGWQSYAKYNRKPGFGGQILYIPSNNVKWVFNTYTFGQDNQRTIAPAAGNGTVNPYCPGISPNPTCSPGSPALAFNGPPINWSKVQRFHEDDSFLYKFYDQPTNAGLSKVAMSLTVDFGCEYGGGVNCWRGPNKANFFGAMEYTRFWFAHNLYAITVGGGMMTNPGRYLALLPPINGATAASGTPYFTENPGQKLWLWDAQLNFQYMPRDWITWWTEVTFRSSNVPYWSGSLGVTPPNAGTGTFSNNGNPTAPVCMNGVSSASVADNCNAEGGYWYPDLRKQEIVWGLGVLVKF
jgi:Putative beta-barrel porin-2, OmpL-like. bbp2